MLGQLSKEQEMKKKALLELIQELKSMDAERLGISPEMDMAGDEMAQSDFAKPSDEEADAAIQRMYDSNEPAPSAAPADMQEPSTPAEEAEDNENILEKPFNEGMDAQQKKQKMIDDLFKNR